MLLGILVAGAIVVVLAYVLVAGLCRMASKPTPPPPGSLQARVQEAEAQDAVRTQRTVQAEIRNTGGGWRT